MRFKSALSALGIAMAIVVSADYVSVAATGNSFLLGRSNSASTTTTLSRTTNGPTLVLNSKAGQPPLKVNRAVKAPNLNADLLDGKHASAFVTRKAPIRMYNANPLPGRQASVPAGGAAVIQSRTLTVPAECGTNTRHRYLLEHEAWWLGGTEYIEMSLTVDTTGQQFGPGSSVLTPDGYGSSASSRVVTLAPGSHTFRLVAGSAAAATAFDPALRATDLGYTCSGGPVSRTAPSAQRSAIAGR